MNAWHLRNAATLAALLVLPLATAACGGKANDARNPGDNTPIIGEPMAPSQAVSSDTAVSANPPSALGDSSARARGGTGVTGPTQGASVGGSAAATRASSGDSSGRRQP